MSSMKQFCHVVLCVLLAMAMFGCSGNRSGITPDVQNNSTDTPRDILVAFGDACIAQDIETACSFLLNPVRWRQTLELAREILPFYGRAVHEAVEVRSESDCVRYNLSLRHPDDPLGRERESRIYVARIRGYDGSVSKWGVEFINPGNGQAGIQRIQNIRARDQLTPSDRNAQWGTLYTHASIMTRSILLYYYYMYPEDMGFTDKRGYMNPDRYHFDALVTHPGPIETIFFIDFDNYESMPPDVLLVENVLYALVQAGTADEDVFVGEYNEDGSINFTREVRLDLDDGIVFETTNDFGDDDDSFLKGFAHFLTPETQSEWETEFSEFDDMEILGGTGGASIGSFDWAVGNGVLGPYDILGILGVRASRNRKSLPQAIQLMQDAAGAQTGIEGAELISNAFYTFGYTLHLLEDLTTPAHVRNDMHGVPIISDIPGLGFLQPDPIEEWGETLNQSFLDETASMFDQLIAESAPIVRDETGFPGNTILQHLYDNAGSIEFPGVEALFKYTALTTNRMCFSEDTIYTSTNSGAANTNYYPDLTYLDLDFAGRSIVHGTPGAPFSTDEYLVACSNGMFDVWWSWFWTTHWFADPELEDVEEALLDGWDILTVADEDDEDYFSNSSTGVREQQWRILYPLVVKSGAAYVHEFYLATH